MFEPGTRNTGTALVGKNIANPISMLNASVDMLYHCGHVHHAQVIEEAIRKTICEDNILTPGNYFLIFKAPECYNQGHLKSNPKRVCQECLQAQGKCSTPCSYFYMFTLLLVIFSQRYFIIIFFVLMQIWVAAPRVQM